MKKTKGNSLGISSGLKWEYKTYKLKRSIVHLSALWKRIMKWISRQAIFKPVSHANWTTGASEKQIMCAPGLNGKILIYASIHPPIVMRKQPLDWEEPWKKFCLGQDPWPSSYLEHISLFNTSFARDFNFNKIVLYFRKTSAFRGHTCVIFWEIKLWRLSDDLNTYKTSWKIRRRKSQSTNHFSIQQSID